MRILFCFTLTLIFSLTTIICQEIEENDEAELIPPVNTSPKGSGDNPITSITTTLTNGTMSLFNRIADKISHGWQRIRNHMQERYQRTMERLQRRAIDAMENLQDYVQKRINSATDESTKQYLERLNSGIQQITDSLKNLMTSVETKVDETINKRRPEIIPEYKIGEP